MAVWRCGGVARRPSRGQNGGTRNARLELWSSLVRSELLAVEPTAVSCGAQNSRRNTGSLCVTGRFVFDRNPVLHAYYTSRPILRARDHTLSLDYTMRYYRGEVSSWAGARCLPFGEPERRRPNICNAATASCGMFLKLRRQRDNKPANGKPQAQQHCMSITTTEPARERHNNHQELCLFLGAETGASVRRSALVLVIAARPACAAVVSEGERTVVGCTQRSPIIIIIDDMITNY